MEALSIVETLSWTTASGFAIEAPRYSLLKRRSGWLMRNVPVEWLGAPEPRNNSAKPIVRRIDVAVLEDFASLPYEPERYLAFADLHGLLADRPHIIAGQKSDLLDLRGSTRPFTLAEWGLFHSHLKIWLGMPLTGEPDFLEGLRFNYQAQFGRSGSSENVRSSPVDSVGYLRAFVQKGFLTDIRLGPPNPQLVTQATSLAAALAFLALWHFDGGKFAKGTERRTCKCGRTFVVGPKGRHRNTTHCSTTCRDRLRKRAYRADQRHSGRKGSV
jgi:hypothetical protein